MTYVYRMVRFGPAVLARVSGSELYNVLEQVFVAAVDLGDDDLSNECFLKIAKAFPESNRVKRLAGLQLEAFGDFKKALELYDELLKRNPGNLLVMKRKACVHKAQGQFEQAITELNSILKYYSADVSSWIELGEIYLSLNDFASGAHCYEEIVLIDPNIAIHHTRLADIYYSIGSYDYQVLARKHYSTSLTLQAAHINLRALYGLIYTCRNILADTNPDNVEKRE
jgi:ER membrane protein complex subunit 2